MQMMSPQSMQLTSMINAVSGQNPAPVGMATLNLHQQQQHANFTLTQAPAVGARVTVTPSLQPLTIPQAMNSKHIFTAASSTGTMMNSARPLPPQLQHGGVAAQVQVVGQRLRPPVYTGEQKAPLNQFDSTKAALYEKLAMKKGTPPSIISLPITNPQQPVAMPMHHHAPAALTTAHAGSTTQHVLADTAPQQDDADFFIPFGPDD